MAASTNIKNVLGSSSISQRGDIWAAHYYDLDDNNKTQRAVSLFHVMNKNGTGR